MNAVDRQKIIDKVNGVCPASNMAPEAATVDLEANLKTHVKAMQAGGLLDPAANYDPKVAAILAE